MRFYTRLSAKTWGMDDTCMAIAMVRQGCLETPVQNADYVRYLSQLSQYSAWQALSRVLESTRADSLQSRSHKVLW